MLVTRHAVIVSVNVALEKMPVYKVRVSVTITVCVPIVAELLVETEIRPAGVIVTSREVRALKADTGALITENVSPPH